ISEQFHKDFSAYKDCRMAVYGMGNNARAVLEDAADFRIIGVVVKDPADGTFCGYPVMGLEECIAQGCDMVVVAAELYAEKIIHDRIAEQCRLHGMKLYGLHAGDLDAAFGHGGLYGYNDDETLTREELRRLIDEHDAISFDIFDTLLVRKTLLPQDVFFIAEETAKRQGIPADNFGMLRIRAEQNVREAHPTLDEIYDELREIAGLEPQTAERLKQIELDTERKVIRANPHMLEMYRYAIGQKKDVCLVSDMYLSSDQIGEFLTQNGISGYQKLFVSNEYRTTKHARLFEVYKDSVKGGKYLHIGDNKTVDGLDARIRGMDAAVVRKAFFRLEHSAYRSIIRQVDRIDERGMVGLFAAKCLCNPFKTDVTVDSAYDYAYLFVAPILTVYALWLMDKVKGTDYDAVLFPSRDGYLLKKMYEDGCRTLGLAEQCPKGIYFYTSRKACISAFCCDEAAFREICGAYAMTERDVYRNVFDDAVPMTDDRGELFACAREQKKRYIRHIEKMGLPPDGSYAFVDLVSGGSCQYFLEKLYFRAMHGLYFCQTTGCVSRPPRIDALLKEHVLDEARYVFRTNQVVLFEAIVTSFEPMAVGFDKDGGCQFAKTTMTDGEKEFLTQAHKGILDYFHDYISSLYCEGIAPRPAVARELLSFRSLDDTGVSDSILRNIRLEDELRGRSFRGKK
ncbi:MAG: hypothetical protein IJ682_05810, partial [Lachnospiraceae bacterium]|nr:hypothetical protein [Lachnospiraceae bacterium]